MCSLWIPLSLPLSSSRRQCRPLKLEVVMSSCRRMEHDMHSYTIRYMDTTCTGTRSNRPARRYMMRPMDSIRMRSMWLVMVHSSPWLTNMRTITAKKTTTTDYFAEKVSSWISVGMKRNGKRRENSPRNIEQSTNWTGLPKIRISQPQLWQ